MSKQLKNAVLFGIPLVVGVLNLRHLDPCRSSAYGWVGCCHSLFCWRLGTNELVSTLVRYDDSGNLVANRCCQACFASLLPLYSYSFRTRHPFGRAFLDGVNAGALALMVVVTFQLGRAALVDFPTIALALLSAIVLFRFRVNSVWLIIISAVAGWILYGD